MKQINAELIESLIAPYKKELQSYIDKYIPNKIVTPITEDVYLVEYSDKIYNQLKNGKARAMCETKTGKIYVRNDIELTGNLIIHEFIHRLSRNRIKTSIFKKWIEGICIIDKKFNYIGINEILTEWITISITKTRENTTYTNGIVIIDEIAKSNHCNMNIILMAYFNSNINLFDTQIYIFCGNKIADLYNGLYNIINNH